MFAGKIKEVLRKNRFLEVLSYLVHNNLLAKSMNFSGEGSFDRSVAGLHEHGSKIGNQYLENFSRPVQGTRILEVGCGLSLATAYHLIKEGGATHVHAYDWFACRHPNDALLVRQYFADCADRVTYVTGDYRRLLDAIPPQSIDLICSNAVLEHVGDLNALFEVLVRLLAPGGSMYHRVDLRCHNRFRRQGELFFHTFGPGLWRAMGSNVGHPNRWLFKDYGELFRRHELAAIFDVIQRFPPDVLAAAERYLKGNIEDYGIAVFDVTLTRKAPSLE